MPLPVQLLLFYLLCVNGAGFLLMGLDKRRAKRGQWRIPEKTLFLPPLLGGTPGAIAGMHVFHHKTKHWYFRFGLPGWSSSWGLRAGCGGSFSDKKKTGTASGGPGLIYSAFS